MKQTAARLVPALVALLLAAFTPSSSLVAQGQRQGGGAGGGAQGGAFGQGRAGRWRRPGGQLPTRDQTGGNGTGDQAAGTAIIRGRVVAADSGTPVRRAQVRAQSGELRANRLVSTDAQGRFEFKDLPAGRWNLTASKAGYMTLRFGQKRSFEAGSPIEISEGQLMERADFSLPRGAAITGRVFDEFGDPVANARVQVLRYQMVQGQRRLNPAGGGDQTDDTGAYRIYGLAPGDYYVSAHASRRQRSIRRRSEQRHDELRVHLLPGHGKRLRSAAPDARCRPGAAERELRAAAGSHGEDHRHGAQLRRAPRFQTEWSR